MSDVITLNGIEVELGSDAARMFISDACRAGESVIDDATLMEKYDLTPEYLQTLASNKQIGRAIRNEREHRLRTGIATRELAAKSYFKAPTVLDSIMMNEQSNARHRIESARELRTIATPENQPNPAAQSEKFIISIVLNSDVEIYNKSRAINPNDEPPDAQPKLTTQPKLIIDNDEKYDE